MFVCVRMCPNLCGRIYGFDPVAGLDYEALLLEKRDDPARRPAVARDRGGQGLRTGPSVAGDDGHGHLGDLGAYSVSVHHRPRFLLRRLCMASGSSRAAFGSVALWPARSIRVVIPARTGSVCVPSSSISRSTMTEATRASGSFGSQTAAAIRRQHSASAAQMQRPYSPESIYISFSATPDLFRGDRVAETTRPRRRKRAVVKTA